MDSGITTESLDSNTTLFTFQDINHANQIQILYHKETSLFGFPSALVAWLNCPQDIEFDTPSHPTSLHYFQLYGCIPVPLSNIIPPDGSKLNLNDIASRLRSFLLKYYTRPTLPYRCPRLKGFKSYALLLFLSFSVKLLFAFSLRPHMHHDNIQFWAGDGEFHRHW